MEPSDPRLTKEAIRDVGQLPPARTPRAAAHDHRHPDASGNDRFVALDLLRTSTSPPERAAIPGPGTAIVIGKKCRGRADRCQRRRRSAAVYDAYTRWTLATAAHAADDVQGEEHRRQPARDQIELYSTPARTTGVQVPLHGQGGVDQRDRPRPGTKAFLNPTRLIEFLDERSAGSAPPPARVPPRSSSAAQARVRRYEDHEVRLRPLPRRPADQGSIAPTASATSSWRRRSSSFAQSFGIGAQFERQVLLPRRPRRAAAPTRRLVPVAIASPARRPPGARQDHARRRLPRAAEPTRPTTSARGRPGARRRGGESSRSTSTSDRRPPRRALKHAGEDAALADRPA